MVSTVNHIWDPAGWVYVSASGFISGYLSFVPYINSKICSYTLFIYITLNFYDALQQDFNGIDQ